MARNALHRDELDDPSLMTLHSKHSPTYALGRSGRARRDFRFAKICMDNFPTVPFRSSLDRVRAEDDSLDESHENEVHGFDTTTDMRYSSTCSINDS